MKRLGIAISTRRLRAVVTGRGRPVWAAERLVTAPDELETALGELAADGPRDVRRARVVLEPDLCQLKFIEGLPRLRRSALRRAVALHAGRWFMKNGGTPVTDVVRLERGGPVLAACAPAEIVEAVERGLRAGGLVLESLAPAAAALARRLPDGVHEWDGGEVRWMVDVRRGRPVRVRRKAVPEEPGERDPALPDPALSAALAGSSLDMVPPSLAARRESLRRRAAVRLAAAGVALWAVAGAIWFSRLDRALDRATARIAALEPVVRPALRVEADIGRATAAIATLEQARAGRSQDLRLLAALTAALPDSVHLLSLRRGNDDSITVAGFAPSAAAVVAMLQGVAGVRGPAIAGPVTRERRWDGVVRDRFALRFAWSPEHTP